MEFSRKHPEKARREFSWPLLCALAVIAVAVIVLPMKWPGRIALAQSPSQIELACPSGTTVLPGFQTLNPSTGKFRQTGCVDGNGRITLQPDFAAGAITSLPVSLTSGVSGILAIANGGLGATSFAAAGVATFIGTPTVGHLATFSTTSGQIQDGGAVPTPGANVSAQTSAATNFGVALGSQTIIASVPVSGNVFVDMHPIVSAIGASCGAGTSTVTPTLNFTAPGGTAESIAFTSPLSVSANGILDNGSPFVSGLTPPESLTFVAKAGTAVTYTTTSVLGPVGCSPAPQYTVYAKAIF